MQTEHVLLLTSLALLAGVAIGVSLSADPGPPAPTSKSLISLGPINCSLFSV